MLFTLHRLFPIPLTQPFRAGVEPPPHTRRMEKEVDTLDDELACTLAISQIKLFPCSPHPYPRTP